MEAAEQNAAIDSGERGDLSAFRPQCLRIAARKAKDDGGDSRQLSVPAAVLWWDLLRGWAKVAFLALAACPAAAARPFCTRIGLPAARVASGGNLGRTRCSIVTTTASTMTR